MIGRKMTHNKANLRDLIAATGLVITNWIKIVDFLSPCDLEIWCMASKQIGHFCTTSSFVYHFKSISEFTVTWVTVGKRSISIRVKIGECLSRVTLQFDEWLWKTIWQLFYTTLSFIHQFKAMGEFKMESQSGIAQFGSKSETFCPMWPWNLTDDHENP